MKRIEHAATEGKRHTVGHFEFGSARHRWTVYDERSERELFHWHGPAGEAKCLVVAEALNAHEWEE